MITYTQFSQVIPQLSDAEVSWLMLYIEHRHRGLTVDGHEHDFDDDELFPNFGFQIMKGNQTQYAWFFSSQTADIGQVAETVQEFFKVHRPNACFSLTWAEYADTLKPEQFDGGAIFVTAHDIKMFHAGEWAREQEREFNGPNSDPIVQVIPA